MTRAYLTQHINSQERELRLAKIRKHASGAIHVDLRVFTIDSAPPYLALSYTWGPPISTFLVHLNGAPFPVRKNLYQFLSTFCVSEKRDNYIWIDQLCINQENVRERSEQVQLMASIYNLCAKLIIFLGPGNEEHAKRFNGWRDVHSLAALLKDQYFTRLWIVQEVLLAAKIDMFVYPGTWVSWTAVKEISRESHVSGKRTGVAPSTWRLIDHHGSRPPWSWKLITCIARFSGKGCKDPRDRVYGLLGLVKPGHKIHVDYNNSVHEVYLDVVRVCCKTFRIREDNHSFYPHNLAAYKDILGRLASRMNFQQSHLVSLLEFLEYLVSQLDTLPRDQAQIMAKNIEMGFKPGPEDSTSEPRSDCTESGRNGWWISISGKTRWFI